MLKTINKFSKLAVLFTILYLLIVLFTSSDLYIVDASTKLVSIFGIAQFTIVGLFLILCICLSIFFGIWSIVYKYRTKEKGKFLTILLTLLNMMMFVYFNMIWAEIIS